MILVRQPQGSKLCGQCAVAMIAGITLEESIKLFTTKGATNSKMVKDVLTGLGFIPDEKTSRIKKTLPLVKQLPDLAICTILYEEEARHWIVWNNGEFLDSELGVYSELPPFYRMLSYIGVKQGG